MPAFRSGKTIAGHLLLHQHAGNHLLGKSEVVGLEGDPDQANATALADRGFVTLAPDAICFEDPCADRELPDLSHLRELQTRLMRGQTLLGKVLHDVSAGIELLHDLPQVDSSRLGFVGHSYGGRTALFAAVLDRRIKVSVCSGGSTNYREMSDVQFDFILPGFLRYGDIEDVVRLIEPASVLILGDDHDKWGIGVEGTISYARSAFQQGRLEGDVYPGGHQFTPEMRERAYQFLESHLFVDVT